MSQETEPNTWRERYSKIVEAWSFPAHVIGAAGAVYEFYEFLETRAFTLPTLACLLFIGYVWYHFFRVRTLKVPGRLTAEPQYKFSAARRKQALGFLIVITTVVALSPVFWYGFWPRRFTIFPRQEFVILLADFSGPQRDQYGVTNLMRERLEEVASRDPEIRLESLGATVPNEQGGVRARKIGEEQGASMVIWGWYTVTAHHAYLAAHVELLRKPKGLTLRNAAETRDVSLSELDSFELQTREAEDMSYLALAAVAALKVENGGDLNRAIEQLNTALSLKSVPEQLAGRGTGYFLRGVAYYYIEQRAQALQDFDEALNLQPHFAEALNDRGAVYLESGNLDAAQADFNAALQWNANLAQVYANRGVVFYKRRDLNQALDQLDRAIQLDSNITAAFDLRGLVRTGLRNYDGAIRDFDRALRLSPGYPIALNNRGNAYAHQGKFERAIQDYDRALSENPSYPEALNDRGYSYFNLGRDAEAIKNYREALMLKPDYLDALRNLAVACESAHDLPCAVANYKAAFSLDTDRDERQAIYARLRRLGAE